MEIKARSHIFYQKHLFSGVLTKKFIEFINCMAVLNAGGIGTFGTSVGSNEIVNEVEETGEAMRDAIVKPEN